MMKRVVEVCDENGDIVESRTIIIDDMTRAPTDQDFIDQVKEDLLDDGYSAGTIENAIYRVVPAA